MANPKPLLTKKRLAQIDQTLRGAWQAQQQNRLDEAEAGYRAVLAFKPTHFDALHLLSVVYYGRGQYAEALTLIGAALTGCGVAASGMCPSPAKRPDVASRPTHPAPGR